MHLTKAMLSLACSSLVLVSYAQNDVRQQPFSLELSPASQIVHLGQYVGMTIMVTNTSHAPITFRSSFRGDQPELFYTIMVDADANKTVEETSYERRVKGHGTIAMDYNSKFVTLKPGDKMRERIHLTKLFNMTKSGSYSIQVERPIQDLNEAGKRISSNKAHLTIVP
jgi:hypothetical protein